MPEPLYYDAESTEALKRGVWKVLGALPIYIIVPLGLFLLRATMRGRDIFPDDKMLRQLMRAAIVVLPIIAGVLMFYKPMRYRVGPGEVVLRRKTYVASLPRGWWMMGAMWSPLLFALVVLVVCAVESAGGGDATMPLTPSQALFTFIVTLLLSVFYGAMFWTESELRSSDEGLRLGTNHFIEWSNIERVVESPAEFQVFHCVSPNLPATYVTKNDRQIEDYFRSMLTRLGVNVVSASTQTASSQLQSLTMMLGIICFGLAAAAVALWRITAWDARWMIIGLAAISIALQTWVEGKRGITRMTKIVPPVNKASFQNS
ncbi:MAG TPA: hypothetical protein VF600_14810 [Abditibacteriaceae bacterium]